MRTYTTQFRSNRGDIGVFARHAGREKAMAFGTSIAYTSGNGAATQPD